MPVIIMSLKYGLKMAFIAAFLSIAASLTLSYFQGFASIDADIIFCEIILLLAWLLGQMTETEYQIRSNLEQEIAARKRAENELKDQLCFLQNLIDTIPNPIYFTDLTAVFMGCNKAFVDFFGMPEEKIINRSIHDIFPCDVAQKLSKPDCALPESVPSVVELTLPNAQGVVREVMVNKTAFFNNEKNVVGSVGIIVDITEQKQLQKDMAQVDRLNLVGEMAAGIAHEIRNPITTVRGFLQLFQINLNTTTLQNHVELMIEELDRANDIIREYLSLAKNRVLNVTPQNLNSIILSIAPLIEADAILSDKNLDFQLGDIPDSLFDETQIRQMLLNLCRNGLEAMTAGGVLTISTFEEGKNIVLTVEDQGTGIDLKLIDKIGTPFVTGKEHGTGLGLAVCYSIATRHNASIAFETGPRGTTFFVRFQKT
ncbi:two-component system sensor histidine kinase NtrB [Candidatus Formimonas warabiya]|nr:ATP-binding protein [Candidatus Formimonas warabiya]